MTDGDRIFSLVLFIMFLALLFFFVLALAVRYRKRKRESELLRAGFSLELQKVKAEMQEQTLRYVSQELHDNLGQIASLIKINLNTIDPAGLPPAAAEKLGDTRELLRRLTRDIKLLSVGLHNRASYESFLQAVRNEIAQLNKTGLFQATLAVADDFPEPQGETGLLVFRMVQEALNNIIKHSQAATVRVQFRADHGTGVLELQDDGVGFDVATQAGGAGAGLANLRSRAQLIGAALYIRSAPDAGTTITIVLPNP